MRNVINLNKNWKFIQQDAGLPETFPADWQTIRQCRSMCRMLRNGRSTDLICIQ